MELDGRGCYRAFLPALGRGESCVNVFVGTPRWTASDALVVAFLAAPVCLVTDTNEPAPRLFADGLRVGDFEGWVFLAAVAFFDAGLRTPALGNHVEHAGSRDQACLLTRIPTNRDESVADGDDGTNPRGGLPRSHLDAVTNFRHTHQLL
jgi:hypothetical protein